MEQINNAVMSLIQTVAAQQANSSAAAEKSGSGEKSGSFKTLLQERRESGDGTEPRAAAAEDCKSDGTADETQLPDELELQKQMAWAALELAQTPVVVVQNDAVPQTEAVNTVETLAAVTVETAAPVQEAPAGAEVLPTADAAQETVGTEMVVQDAAPQTVRSTESEDGTARTDAVPVETAARKSAERTVPQDEAEHAESDPTQEEPGAETPVFRELRDIPVKVGEAQTAVRSGSEAAEVESQIDSAMVQAFKSGENRIELQLTPEHLGRIKVEMTWEADGTLRVALHAESDHTRGLLEKDAAGLQALLSRSAQQEVKVELPDRQEHQQLFEDGRQGGNRQGRQSQQQQEHRQNEQDFLHQLRLGLIPTEDAT